MSGVLERFAPLFHPRSVAFIGASREIRKWGFVILFHLLHGGYKGKVFPINPKDKEILGLPAYPSVLDVPEAIDMAVIVVPPLAVLQALQDCVAKGVKAGVVITAGFAEMGEEGRRLQSQMVEIARQGGMRLVGPNCNGVMNPYIGLHPHMPPAFPKPGPLAVVSQSGNIATSLVTRATVHGMGISRYVSSGNEADLHIEDFLEYFGDDPDTKVIMAYIEGIRDGKRFFEVSRKVTRKKPIVALKVGYTQAGARAARSHTAALAGSDQVFNALCRQAGITRVLDMNELFYVASAFLRQPLPQGKRVGMVTGGGGWGVVGADACARVGLEVTDLPEETLRELDSFLPSWWNRGNPVDIVAGSRAGDIRDSLAALFKCPVVDSVILLGRIGLGQRRIDMLKSSRLAAEYGFDALAAETSKEEREVAQVIIDAIDSYGKPIVVASDMAIASAAKDESIQMLEHSGIVCYPMPDDAATVLAHLARYSEYLRESH